MDWNRWWRVSFQCHIIHNKGWFANPKWTSRFVETLWCPIWSLLPWKLTYPRQQKMMVGRWNALSKRSLWKGSTFFHFRRVLGVSPGALINSAGVSRAQLKGLDLLWPKYSTRRQSYVSMLVVNISPFYIRVTRVGWINHKSALDVGGASFCWRCSYLFFWKYHWVLIDSVQVHYRVRSRNLFVHFQNICLF